ncbi:MAG: antibiotic biosynthesis monooxygenase, partial [Alphaproteobacteria bacterium]|nr:antibiotic biosynthesis monooxygenase [Alphaproteobacteria bacterium]
NYQLNDCVDPDAFLAICRQVGNEFTSAQPGFIEREIGRNDDGTWLIAVHWNAAIDAHNSISNIDTIPDVVKTYMGMINRDTLKRWVFDIV